MSMSLSKRLLKYLLFITIIATSMWGGKHNKTSDIAQLGHYLHVKNIIKSENFHLKQSSFHLTHCSGKKKFRWPSWDFTCINQGTSVPNSVQFGYAVSGKISKNQLKITNA